MNKKLVAILLVFCLSVVTVFSCVSCVDAKSDEPERTEERNTYNHTMTLIEGATLSWEILDEDTIIRSNSDSKIASTSISTDDWKIYFKGLKAGTTTVKFDDYDTDYVFTVNVLSKSTVQKKADKLLKAKIKKLKKKTKYIYTDINGDGLKDLVTSTKFYYYNYREGKVLYRSHTSYKNIYLASDKKTLYGEYSKSTYKAYNGSKKEFKELGEFARWDDHYLLKYDMDSCESGFMQYTAYGKKMYKASHDYVYYDFSYDQDDYQYIDFTKTTMLKMMKGSSVPEGISMKITVKGAKKLSWKKR